jgi:hypothetical protein
MNALDPAHAAEAVRAAAPNRVRSAVNSPSVVVPTGRLSSVRRRSGLLAVVSVAFAFAWPLQGGGNLEIAHYVLVKALAAGTASVEGALGEVGGAVTNDLMLVDGRVYSNKAPGLAFAALPPYLVLDAAGMSLDGDPARPLWALGLVVAVLPAFGALLVVRRLGDRVAPSFGAAAAVSIGLGTLLLPYATLFLNHALSAFLVVAAFALAGARRTTVVALGGLLAGLAIVVEYTNAVAAAVLGVYALTRGDRARRLAVWAAGVLLGAAPLLVYNQLAFGSAFHSSYAADAKGASPDLFGLPSLDVTLELLLSDHGLLVLSPVIAAALAGLLVLWRGGRRAEAATIGTVVLGYVALDAAFYSPFGGFSPGPRYLIPVLPLLGIPLAAAFATLPLVTGGLAAASSLAMIGLTATHPDAGYDGRWLDRAFDGEVSQTAASLVGITGWVAVLPLLAAAALAAVFAALSLPKLRVRPLEPVGAGAALLGWAAVALAAPATGTTGDYAAYVPAFAVVAAAGAIAYLYTRRPWPRLDAAVARRVGSP